MAAQTQLVSKKRLIKGQSMVEYTFIISLVALALVLAFSTLGLQLTDFFDLSGDKISAIIK